MKLDADITLSVVQPLQAFDLEQRGRSLAQIVSALAEAKAAGVSVDDALKMVALDT